MKQKFPPTDQLEMQRRGWVVEKALLEAEIRELEEEVASETYSTCASFGTAFQASKPVTVSTFNPCYETKLYKSYRRANSM